MIELPEAVVLARQVNQTLSGKTIARATANQSPHKFAWYTGDPAEYNHLLAGSAIGHAEGVACHVHIQAGDRSLVLSVPMRYYHPGEKLPTKHQLLLEFTDGCAVSCTVQMWGGMLCLAEGQPAGYADYDTALAKPSPVTPAFDWAYFQSLFDNTTGKMSAKEFLATKQRIPGLGNGVLQDILWTARIHPRRKLSELSEADLHAMFSAVKSVLQAMIDGGGRDTERDLFWQPGGYKTILSKNTAGAGCPACGTMIAKEPYLGGAIYYCEVCQKLR